MSKTTTFHRVRCWQTVGGIEVSAGESPIAWNFAADAKREANRLADAPLPDGVDATRYAVLEVTEVTLMECGRSAIQGGDQ